MDKRLAVAWLGVALGALILVAGAAHSVAITGTAFEKRGGLDGRWMVLFSFGFDLMAGGAAMALAGWLAVRGSEAALWFAGAAAAFLWIHMAIVAAAFSPIPPIVYGLYLVLWWLWARPAPPRRAGSTA